MVSCRSPLISIQVRKRRRAVDRCRLDGGPGSRARLLGCQAAGAARCEALGEFAPIDGPLSTPLSPVAGVGEVNGVWCGTAADPGVSRELRRAIGHHELVKILFGCAMLSRILDLKLSLHSV